MRFTMDLFSVLLLLFISIRLSSAVDAGLCDGSYCIQQYIKGFVNAATNTLTSDDDDDDDDEADDDDDNITPTYDTNLHCSLDFELAACTNKALLSCGSTKTLLSLGRAVLSYMVYDDKLQVCPNHKKLDYTKLLDQQLKLNDDYGTMLWKEKIKAISSTQYSSCGEKVDRTCILQFVSKMKMKPDLCTNIRFKYQCLAKWNQECPATITKALLEVFPEEAEKVLSVLCP